MPQKKIKPSTGVSIGGNVNTNGGDIAGGNVNKGNVYHSSKINISEVDDLFQPIYDKINTSKKIPLKSKKLVKDYVSEIQSEIIKGEKKDDGVIEDRLKNIAIMTPDILEVILATLANPIIGLGVVVKKVTEKYIKDKNGKDVKKNE